MYRDLFGSEICAAAPDGDVVADDDVFHAAPAFEAIVATDPKTMRKRTIDVKTRVRHHAPAGVYAVVIPGNDGIGFVRTGDAIVTPCIFESPESVRPHPGLRIDAFSESRCQGDDLTADAAGAVFEN